MTDTRLGECIICLETITKIAIYKQCGHYVCSDCFKKCLLHNPGPNKIFKCQLCRTNVLDIMTHSKLVSIKSKDSETNSEITDIESVMTQTSSKKTCIWLASFFMCMLGLLSIMIILNITLR